VIYEYACHEGNYGMAHILSAALKNNKQKGKAGGALPNYQSSSRSVSVQCGPSSLK